MESVILKSRKIYERIYKGTTKMHLYNFENSPITLILEFPVHGIFEKGRAWHKCLNKTPEKLKKISSMTGIMDN